MPPATPTQHPPTPPGEQTGPDAVLLPEGFALAEASFRQAGTDLLVSGADGVDLLFPGFFADGGPPDLVSANGVRMAGSLVAMLADTDAPVGLGDAVLGAGSPAAGEVAAVSGVLNVIRTDGTPGVLAPGDAVYPGDMLETGPDGTASIRIGGETVLGLGGGARMILHSGALDPGAPVAATAGPGEYAFACGAASRPLTIHTPAGRIQSDGADMVFTYLEGAGLRVILIPGAGGTLGTILVENEAGSLQMALAYQLVLVEGWAMAPDLKGLLSSHDIIMGYSRILGGLPSSCDSNPLVAAARTADSGDLGDPDIQQLAAFETAAGDDTAVDAAFPDARVVVTQHDPLANGGSDPVTVPRVSVDPWTPAASDAPSPGGDGNSNESLITIPTLAPLQRPTFPEPPGIRPPIQADMTVDDWGPGLRDWTVLVPQEPTAYGRGVFYRQPPRYDEPERFVFRPLDADDIAGQYYPTNGATMVLLSPGPLTETTESGRGAEIKDIERLFFEVPSGTLVDDTDPRNPSRPVDGAAMKTRIEVNPGDRVGFDWMFDARDQVAGGADDYAVFMANGLWYRLASVGDVGEFGASGWRTSEWTYTGAGPRAVTIGFVVLNDLDDFNEPRLLVDNVRLNRPLSAEHQEIGDAQVKGVGALRTFVVPPTANDDPDTIATTEDAAVVIRAADLLANDTDPNAERTLSITGLDDGGTAGTLAFADPATAPLETVTYTPARESQRLAAGDVATDSFRYEIASPSGGRDTALVTVTIVGVNDAPTAGSVRLSVEEDGSSATGVFAGADIDTDDNRQTLTYAFTRPPSEGSAAIDGDGTFTFDPGSGFQDLALGQTREVPFSYTATDRHGGVSGEAAVTVSIVGANDAPVAADAAFDAGEDIPSAALAFGARDIDTDDGPESLTYIVTRPPSGGSVAINGDGTFTFDPGTDFEDLATGETRAVTFGYRAADRHGAESGDATVTLTVAGANDAPVANAVERTTNEDAGFFGIDLLDGTVTSDVDASDVLTVVVAPNFTGAGGRNLVVDTSSVPGALAFDPGVFGDLAAGEVATLVFTYTVDDRRGQSNSTATSTVTVTVEGRNDAPVADDETYTVAEDAAWTEDAGDGILAGDRDPDASDSIEISGVAGVPGILGQRFELPSGAFLTVNPDGSLAYDQNGRFSGLKRQEIATDSFEYTVSDGYGATDTGRVTIRIVGLNDAPRAGDDALAAGEDVAVAVTAAQGVLANDGDPDGDPLSVIPFSQVSALGARVTMAADGTYAYDPTGSAAIQALGDGDTLIDSFGYTVRDGDGATDRGTVTITVTGANDAPAASDVSFRIFRGSTLRVDAERGVLLNDADVDGGDALGLTAVNGQAATAGSQVVLSSGALLTVNADGTFFYDPNGRFDGLGGEDTALDTFTYTVSDAAGLTDTATVTVTVTGFEEQPVGSFDRDLTDWSSAGGFARSPAHAGSGTGDRVFGATDGPLMAVLEANGASASEIEATLGLAPGALPRDTDLTRPVDGGALWTEVAVKTGDEIRFDWNFDSRETAATTGANDFAVFTVSNGARARVFELSDARAIGDDGASGWQTFSYDPTDDFGVDTAGRSLTIGFAVVNDQNAANPSHLLVDNVRIAWDLPAPVNDAVTVRADTVLTADPGRGLLANDRDAANTGTLTVSAVNPTVLDDGAANVGAPIVLASGAVLTVDADGTFALDPSGSADLRSLGEGEVFTDEFTYAIADGNERASLGTASVRITFTGVNDAPVPGDDRAVTDEHSVVRIAAERLLANDSDPDGGDALTITAVDGGATTGRVTLAGNGLIAYDPDGRFSGLAPGEEAVDTFRYTVADGNGGSATATVTVRVLGQADPPAPPGQIVASFEDGPPGAWDPAWDRIKPFGSEPVSIVTAYRETDGAGGTFNPTGGDRMAVLEAFGSFADPATSVAGFLGVTALPSDSDGTRAADGSAMKTTITLNAGDEISFDWMFDARDRSVGGTEVFNDYAVLTVAGPGGREVFTLADVRQTGDFAATGWRASSYAAAAGGEYTFGFAVMNDAVSHGLGDPRNSRLLVDNVRLGREFGDAYQRLDGGPGDPFQTWARPPTANADTAATGEDTPITILPGDLLANDVPPNAGGPLGLSELDVSATAGAVTRGTDGAILYDPRGAFDALNAGETATDRFFYTVTADNGGTARAEVSITVNGANDAPVARGDVVATGEDNAVTGNLLADNGGGEDTDVDGDSLSVTRVNGAAANVGSTIALASGALLLVNADGTFSYDPDGRFEVLGPGDTVTDTFTYSVDDGQGGTATAAVSVLVSGVNDAPVASDDASSTTEDTAVTIDLVGNDFDAEAATPAIAGLNDSATIGLLTPNGDGTVTYDPSGRFDVLRDGDVAVDTFEYTIDDGMGGTDAATVTVEVTGVDDAPVAAADEASTSEDGPVTIALLTNDTDAEGDPLAITGVDDAGTIGLVTLNGDGTVTYDPDGRFEALSDGETATDTFRYTVSDGTGLTDTATVTVTVTGVDEGGAGSGDLVNSFEGVIDPAVSRGAVSVAFRYDEPDGDRGAFSPTDGSSMAVLTASGSSALSLQFFLGLSDALPADFGDSSAPTDGSALRLTVDVEAGERISFDWMFDANDVVQPPLGDFARPGFNDFAVFTADGEWFALSDVRQVTNEDGRLGATGWRTSIYTARSDGPLTIGFAVVNDGTTSADSHLLVDNVRVDRDFDPESYTVVRSDPSGALDTLVRNPDV